MNIKINIHHKRVTVITLKPQFNVITVAPKCQENLRRGTDGNYRTKGINTG